MALTIAVDEDYGYVIIVGVMSMLFSYGIGACIFFYRMKHGIQYPAMFSEKDNKFNCLQRIHGNYLEMFPTFLVLLFCGGLAHPFSSAIAGLVYLLGRLVYSIGYNTGDPNKRLFGIWWYFGIIYLYYSTIELALRLLKWL